MVLDNVQAYARQRDQQIGTSNRMILGTGATAVEMENCPPDAFALLPLLERIKQGHCSELTVERILDEIDWTHIETISGLHWLQALVMFVPTLTEYRQEVAAMFTTDTAKLQINPTRHTKVHPLGTNNANEVSTQGMKDALTDFLNQLGMTENTYQDEIMFFTGNGKTFEGIAKVKKYLSGEESHFKSLRFVCPGLEIWHTKWTDPSCICRGHWGKSFDKTDPSTLGYIARAIRISEPSDLKKVDFYAHF